MILTALAGRGTDAALLGQPQTVVLAEPVNGLGPDGVRWIRLLLKSLAAEGRTVFVSSHLMSEMPQTATRLVVLGRGQLLAGPGVTVLNDGTGLLRVSGTTAEQIGTAAWRAHLPVYGLTPTRASLEEAFMQVTQNGIAHQRSAAGAVPVWVNVRRPVPVPGGQSAPTQREYGAICPVCHRGKPLLRRARRCLRSGRGDRDASLA